MKIVYLASETDTFPRAGLTHRSLLTFVEEQNIKEKQ